MTLKELREEILKTKHSEWFKDQAMLKIEIPYLNILDEFKGFVAAYKYIDDQVKGFNDISDAIPEVLDTSKEHLTSIRNHMVSFFNDNKRHDESSLNNAWEQVQNRVDDILEDRYNPTFLMGRPETVFLKELFNINPESIDAAVSFLTGQDIPRIEEPQNFFGAIMAYEFKLNDGSGILNRRKKESNSLSSLKSEFSSHLTESEKHLQQFLSQSKHKTETDAKSIDDFLTDKKGAFDTWFDGSSKSFGEFDDASKKRIEELEHTYQEKLRLAKPAEYWRKRAEKLKGEGKLWLRWLALCVTVSAISLFVLLWQIPDGMLLNIFAGEASAIKWALVYITFLSFIAFGIRTLAKITFSSFHLARDAEEREQLTYVYLALMQEAKIDEKDRSLIMQALFSRADTGLLKEDSSPTMPGIVDRFMQR